MKTTASTIKEKLHKVIEGIDNEKVLKAFYTILENYRMEAEDYELTDEQFTVVEKADAVTRKGGPKAILEKNTGQMAN